MSARKRDPFLCKHIEKLLRVVVAIEASSLEELRTEETVAGFIRQAGLSFDPRGIYGDDNRFMNESRFGLWQQPEQLAAALCWLSTFSIQRTLEIGTFKGWTTTILAAYLKRFNADHSLITIDPVCQFYEYPFWQELGISYMETDSSALKGREFDLCFIDGDHSYTALNADYSNVGELARICLIHDINEELCPDVERFWMEMQQLHQDKTYEFTGHPNNLKVMGIGAIVQQGWEQGQ